MLISERLKFKKMNNDVLILSPIINNDPELPVKAFSNILQNNQNSSVNAQFRSENTPKKALFLNSINSTPSFLSGSIQLDESGDYQVRNLNSFNEASPFLKNRLNLPAEVHLSYNKFSPFANSHLLKNIVALKNNESNKYSMSENFQIADENNSMSFMQTKSMNMSDNGSPMQIDSSLVEKTTVINSLNKNLIFNNALISPQVYNAISKSGRQVFTRNTSTPLNTDLLSKRFIKTQHSSNLNFSKKNKDSKFDKDNLKNFNYQHSTQNNDKMICESFKTDTDSNEIMDIEQAKNRGVEVNNLKVDLIGEDQLFRRTLFNWANENQKKSEGLMNDNQFNCLIRKTQGAVLSATEYESLNTSTESNQSLKLSWTEGNSRLIGDFSRSFCLDVVPCKHPELKAISPDTVFELVNGLHLNSVYQFKIYDCRFPYEFNGGHIKSAINIYIPEDLIKVLFQSNELLLPSSRKNISDVGPIILIFHCEFSSERAPKMMRFLRNYDREMNQKRYPKLFYPEIYLLEGGYKALYEKHKQICEPINYFPMLHPDYTEELKASQTKYKYYEDMQSKAELKKRLQALQ